MSLNDSDRLTALRSLRDLLADRLMDAEPRETAPLARQLRDVLRDVAELERDVPKGSIVDELREHKDRKAGRSRTPRPVAASGSDGE
jgi:hypothetical protein